MKKLTLDRETLKLLTPSDSAQIHGGMKKNVSDDGNSGCSKGNPCTSACTEGSKNCTPTPTQPKKTR
ncbi:hypothetical protein [Candidatus Accumulibacter aalborgensis]|uniref:hypothetical protein n=1 Tax=Candidatus Accumulibacter aalborgensis TaxID=1860102 RepID=UPI0016440EAD|nr:hypothetical protein [Candidatus Accumulibacter aalborgensis]